MTAPHTLMPLLAAMLLGLPATAASQLADTSTAAFIATVRDATVRFRDRDAAVRAGYRPIGPDFPGMGEHWISVPLLLEGAVDPRRPPILEYVEINGAPVLVGVAFGVLLQPGATPPVDGMPVGAAAWHYHGGTVSEESLVLGHAHGHQPPADRPTVAVLHVWTWLDNPDGPFATDNWALPFVRLGLKPPDVAPNAETAHALALAAGGKEYYRAVVAVASRGDTAAQDEVVEHLTATALEIRQLLRDLPLERALVEAADRWRELRRVVLARSGVRLP